jgi:dihydroflavonol-4-reductase
MKKLLITGASGFLGSHMVIEGLKKGYTIVATTKTAAKEKDALSIISKYVNETQLSNLSFVHCDLTSPENWDFAVAGCDAILHVASPFPLGLPKHEDDLIIPARKGVQYVFEAAIKNNINRIIQTSSVVALVYGHGAGKTNFDENDWTNLNSPLITAYIKSKTLAEQDVWNYSKSNPELKVTCINPAFILGPVLGKDVGTSADIILKLMKGEYPGVPKLGFPIVDVRDVVELHYKALLSDASIGQRYAAVSNSIWFKDIASNILEAQPGYHKKVKTKELPIWFIKIFALFDKSAKMIIHELGTCTNVSNQKAKNDLNHFPISAGEAVKATANSLVHLGLV